MTMGLLGVGFIFLILFLLYKILRTVFHLLKKSAKSVSGWFGSRHYDDPYAKMPRDAFPEELTPMYFISESDFFRIANKAAYRNPRIEGADVNGNSISLEISSQSGLSKNHATLTFTLSGASIGEYSMRTDNYDSLIPQHVGDKIQFEIRRHVGIES